MSLSARQKVWQACSYLLLIALAVTGCTTLLEQEGANPPPVVEQTATATNTPVPVDEPEATPDPAETIITLKIWIPPQFDPESDTEAGQIFQERLDDFISRRPNVQIETRIKDVEGPGGLLNTLKTASAAAPLALPDLVALPYEGLQVAVSEGLVRPFDGLTDAMDDPDWYDFARQFAHVQNNLFGIPFAGDALVMVYRPENIEEAPNTWAQALENAETIAFPASDPNALLTLTLYRASTGNILDEDGQPILEMAPLTDTLTFFSQGSQNNVFPFWLTQYESDEQAWGGYEEGQADIVITWASRYLQTMPQDSAATTIPTPGEERYTTATGWAWALASPDSARQALSAELAEFLATSDYLATWNAAAGYLPPRPSSISTWEDTPTIANFANQVCPSAHVVPSRENLSQLGPALSQSTANVLKEQTDPATAAQNAIEQITEP
jgi:ABC-type glycerol-3-phosphate transport system substrate-binding protein